MLKESEIILTRGPSSLVFFSFGVTALFRITLGNHTSRYPFARNLYSVKEKIKKKKVLSLITTCTSHLASFMQGPFGTEPREVLELRSLCSRHFICSPTSSHSRSGENAYFALPSIPSNERGGA